MAVHVGNRVLAMRKILLVVLLMVTPWVYATPMSFTGQGASPEAATAAAKASAHRMGKYDVILTILKQDKKTWVCTLVVEY
jgi:hypothetical protein